MRRVTPPQVPMQIPTQTYKLRLFDIQEDKVVSELRRTFRTEKAAHRALLKEDEGEVEWHEYMGDLHEPTDLRYQAQVIDADGQVLARYLYLERRTGSVIVANGHAISGTWAAQNRSMEWILVREGSDRRLWERYGRRADPKFDDSEPAFGTETDLGGEPS